MTDKSVFTDEEWHALTDSPLLVVQAVFLAGEHGPISMMKEAGASARAISRPGERGPANELIGQIVAEANTKEARADAREHRGPTPQAAIDSALHDLEPAATYLNHALSLNPKSSMARYELAMLHSTQGDIGTAAEELQNLTADDPEATARLKALAQGLQQLALLWQI